MNRSTLAGVALVASTLVAQPPTMPAAAAPEQPQECYTTSAHDTTPNHRIIDRVTTVTIRGVPVPVVTWRWLDIETITSYRICTSVRSASVKVLSVFFRYSSTKPMWCGNTGVGFKRYKIEWMARDGYGTSISRDFRVHCQRGMYGASGFVEFGPQAKILYYEPNRFGFPKADFETKAVIRLLPDNWAPSMSMTLRLPE